MAPISKASASLLRIRAVTSRAKTLQPFAATQFRRKITASDGQELGDDLGGAGGQQAPPRKPGSPEAVKRNWCVDPDMTCMISLMMAYTGTN
jgi:hypothetical protein